MSEPITIYCTTAHEWAARNFQPGDAMTVNSPSLVREMLASERWSLTEPVVKPVVIAPPVVVAPAAVPAVTPKRKRRA